MKPKISIITVCFNSENTITKTIESVLNQTYKNIEYIIIDGASQDNTLNIIKHYESKHSQIKCISEPDDGIYNAMNKGILAATGHIIGIINSDDWYEDNAVEMAVNSQNINGDGVHYGYMRLIKNGKEYNIERSNFNFLNERMIQHPTCFITKNIYDQFGSFIETYKSAADYELMIRLQKSGVSFFMMDSIITNFTLGGTSSTIISGLENLSIRRTYSFISKRKFMYKYCELKSKYILKKITNYGN